MTGGMVGQETVDGIVMEAKGFWIIGLLRALIGFGQNAVSNRKFLSLIHIYSFRTSLNLDIWR